MAARPSWDGYLRLSLIVVPVKAYSASVKGASEIGFHMLHKTCHSRIRYQKVCPVHGEVKADEIVSGYEYSKGKYVIVDDEEIAELRGDTEKTIEIDGFVPQSAVDPLYFSGRSYYLVPDGSSAGHSYDVLADVMAGEELVGVAEAVMFGRENLGIVRSKDGVLIFSRIEYADEIRPISTFSRDRKPHKISAEERKLAKTLVAASTRDELDFERYKDDSAIRLRKAIEGKVKGSRIVEERGRPEPKVINLMDALKKSLHRAKPAGAVHRATRVGRSAKGTSKRRRTA